MSFILNGPLAFIVVLSALCLLAPRSVESRRLSRRIDTQLEPEDLGEMPQDDGEATHPRRPDSFRTIEELNNYLAKMRQYYSMLGRPRFGRSVDEGVRERPRFVSSRA